MTERTSYAPGTPNWIDLGSPDTAASAAFYGGLFGWTAEEGPAEFGGYRMALKDGKPVAGIGPAQSEGCWWTSYIATADADATTKEIAANGGSVLVEPMDIPGVGRMAVFTDPSGAAFSIWQPDPFPGAQLVNEDGTWSWNELTTRDPEAAKSFYGAVFGWTYDTMSMEGGPDYTVLQVGGEGVGGIMPMGDEFPAEVPDHWMVYFTVADVDASCAKASDLAGAVSIPPFDVPGVGRIAVLNGPHGEVFSLITPPAAP